MKKLLLLSFLAISLSSCDKDDDKKEDCFCDAARFSIKGQDGYFYVRNLQIDCDTRKPLNDLPGNPDAIYEGCETWE